MAQPDTTPAQEKTDADGNVITDAAGEIVLQADKLKRGCLGKLCYDGNRRKPVDFEIMPYYGFGLVSIDLGIAFNLEQRNDIGFDFHFRPGVRIFPFMGLFIRAFLDLTAAQISTATSSTGAIRASFEGNLGVGAGWQFKLGPWGIFGEFSLQPRLWGAGAFNFPIEFRVGILLEP